MDREQEEMQFLGLFGIYLESYKIIISYRKVFSQITLALILPLSLIYLGHIEATDLIISRIIHNEIQRDYTPENSRRYEKLSDLISSEWATFWLIKVAYFTFLLIFSLLSTSAVVFTVASIYTGRDVTFRKVFTVLPKVWKRLMVTFLCTFLAFFLYNVVLVLILVLWTFTMGQTRAGPYVLLAVLIAYGVGFVYMTVVWHLASVVSVLEDSYGFKAMTKSNELIKGKMWIAVVIFLILNLSMAGIQILFESLVVKGSMTLIGRVGFGIVSLLLLFTLFLFGLVVQTVIYFVCKSYHHENIDKSTLSDHLEVYLGEYVPLKAKDVQLEEYHV